MRGTGTATLPVCHLSLLDPAFMCSMLKDEWKKVEELLDAALELEPHERRRFLDDVGASTPEVRREVEGLLACDEQTNGFLAAPALAFSADFFDGDDPNQRAGQTIGNYRIIREVGRGGMGTVFLAERADGEFQQEVALKVVRRSFADADLARRFRRERQILASLNHPNIARLLDGGVSSDGEPFLAMEYVEGTRIDVYAEAQQLSTNARLGLFREVCAAVQYAHQNLVIHRDLKPSNILVTAEGIPKLLDFGIAKLLDSETGDTDAHTVTELGVMTPEYASPEQVRGLQVTTASDVYSLGVVLYELLAGHRPYRINSRKPEEIARAICTQEPEKPSDAATRPHGDAENQSQAWQAVSASPLHPVPPSQLRGDLDNIVLMAMRKEPARRYASVGQFSEDIRRHIDGLPVIARKDTFKYRSAKFIKRNKVGVAAAALVVLTLIVGIIGVAWQAAAAKGQARMAAQERDRARIEAAKAERINAFMQSIFASADPSWYSSGRGQRGEVKVVDVLEQAGRRVDAELKDEPEIRAELHHTIGTTYQSLGQYEPAQTHFRAAVDAYRGLYGERHPEVAEALYYLGASMGSSGDQAGSLALFRQSLEIFRTIDPYNANVPYLLADFAANLNFAGQNAVAEQAAWEGLALARQRYGEEHMLTVSLLSRLALIYETRGDLSQAETFYRSALDTINRVPNGRFQSSMIVALLGRLSKWRGEFKQAEMQLREAIDISAQTQNETHPQRIDYLLMLAETHYLQGAYADAEKEASSALDLFRRGAGGRLRQRLKGLTLLSLINTKTKRRAGAIQYLRAALPLLKNLPLEEKHLDEGLLGEALFAMEREKEGKALLVESYTYYARTYGEQNPQAIVVRQRLERLEAATRSR